MAVQPQRTWYRTDVTIGRALLLIGFLVVLAAAFGWVTGTAVNVFELGVAIALLGMAVG